MPTKDNGRTEGQPLCVRMNPAERLESRQKAAQSRIRESELVRRLMRAYDPSRPPWEEMTRQTFPVTRQTSQPGELAIEYDQEDAR